MHRYLSMSSKSPIEKVNAALAASKHIHRQAKRLAELATELSRPRPEFARAALKARTLAVVTYDRALTDR